MKKMQKGFTLIELLVVIAIIGILSSVVITSMTSARTKAKTAAFKAEIAGMVGPLILICDSADIVAGDVPATATHAAGTLVDSDCDGDGTFEVTFAPASTGSGGACTLGTVTENGATFTGC